ncbi:MAG: fructosamine kinase family protein, partial [Planctomycetota bacterium]
MSCSRTRANQRAVERALAEAGLGSEVVAGRDLSGGCIHRVRELELADGTRVVSKTNDADRLGLFEEEALGLETLAETGTVLVPRPLAVCAAGGVACLLIEALAPGEANGETWRQFGR